MTNFISEDTTLGTVTGDLKGAVSARILKITPGENGKLFFEVQHTFVTEAGDTIRIDVSTAEGTPISEAHLSRRIRATTDSWWDWKVYWCVGSH